MSDDENIVERQPSAVGWMVFSHCEGEEPQPVAFFFCRGAKALAEELHGRRDADGEPAIFDAGIAPAVLISGEGDSCGLFAANHYDDVEGIKALAAGAGLSAAAWEPEADAEEEVP